MATSKLKALQMWCKRALEGYRDVEIVDMTKSWRSGLAFCAMIHKYRPDLIDYDSLDKENVFENNKLAFDVAEKDLNIAALLEAADMVAMKVPDRLSVITYVAQYHNYFKDKPVLGGPGVRMGGKTTGGVKRHHEGSEASSRPDVKRFTPAQENRQDKPKEKPKHQRIASMGDTCQICGNKVYLLERHFEDSKLYHRSCFRHSDLSPTSKVYARPAGLFGKDDKHKEGPVNGMSQLGKGFAAPTSEPDRSKSAVGATHAKTSLNFNGTKVVDAKNSEKEQTGHSDTTQNGPVSWRDRNKLSSVPEKLKDESDKRTDLGNKQSDLTSKSDRKPFSTNKDSKPFSTNKDSKPFSTNKDSMSELTNNQNESQNSKVKNAWLPTSKDSSSKVDERTPRGGATPVPKPRQSVFKDTDITVSTNVDRTKRKEEKMDVDELVDRTKQSDSKSGESRFGQKESLTKTSETRKLPLVLQMVEGKEKSKEHSSRSEVRKGKMEAAETGDPKPTPRRFLKKNEKKNHGSTEKLNKNEAVSGSTERLNKSEKNVTVSTGRLKKSEKKLTGSTERLDKSEKTVFGSKEKLTKTKKSTEKMDKTAGEKLRDVKSKSQHKTEDVSRMEKSVPHERPRTPPRPSGSSSDEVRTPPPLPRTTPPSLGAGLRPTSPPLPKRTSQAVSPIPSPRVPSGPPKPCRSNFLDEPKESSNFTHDVRKSEPMEVDELIAKTRNWTPGAEPVAVMVHPGEQKKDPSEQAVLGGLLKSLANVRQRQPETTTNLEQITEVKTRIVSPPKSKNQIHTTDLSLKTKDDGATISHMRNVHIEIKSSDDSRSLSHISKDITKHKVTKTSEIIIDTTPIPAWQKEMAKRKADKDSKIKPRPKSSHFIVDPEKGFEEVTFTVPHRSKLQNGNENKSKGKINVDTTPTPSWKTDITKRKVDNAKPARPKSMELLRDNQGMLSLANQANNNSSDNEYKLNKQKQMHNGKLSSTTESNNNPEVNKTDWQLEAQKRQQARKGNYVDPEKSKPNPCDNKNIDIGNSSRTQMTSDTRSGVLDNGLGRKVISTKADEKVHPTPISRPALTKISPGRAFNFDETSSLESSTEGSPRNEKNKGRKPPPRPTSPPAINRGQKYHKPNTPTQPTPPKFGASPGKLSASEIQRQLMDIDSKLTDLELKGRRLEDSIRNAQEDEEDELMIDWFLLVSEKNELVRQEADLIYANRANELEDEQESVKEELRQLLDKPKKTKADKKEEEFLLGKLLHIVDQRDNIVYSIDEDKHRYEEEDKEIASVLTKKGFSRSQEDLN